ncbi:MAG: Fic family protein [Acidimicrobiales bacterium]
MARYEELIWQGSPAGQTRRERTQCSYRAYVPDPLAKRVLALPADLVADLSDADRAVGALQDHQTGLASVESVARLVLRAEAVGSSYIEGLQVSARRLAKEEFAERAGLPTADDTARAVLGNIRALGGALDLADVERPITVEDLCTLHRQLLAGTRDEHWAGMVRQEQNWIGGVNPCRAAYVPPHHEHVLGLLEDLCSYVSGDDHPPIVQAALTHAQFETIHPFVDGNGRVGRALIHLVLRRRGLAPNFVPAVSLILATNAGAYIAGLVSFRYDASAEDPVAAGAANQWIDAFVNALLRACADAAAFADQLDRLEEHWREAASPARRRSATDLLLSALPGIPILTVKTAAEAIGRSRKRTNDAVNHLHACGVLRQGTVGRRNRVFEVADLLAAITQFERRLASPAADTAIARPIRAVPARKPRTGKD